MCEVLIVADDLTGSLDSAVGFARADKRVMVARTLADVAQCVDRGADVISVNTASRNGTETAAIAAVEAMGEVIDLQSVRVIMKKVDSRLKGHPGAEGRALARLASRDTLVAAPALPRMGRIQSQSKLSGSGIEGAISMSERLGTGMVVPDVTSQDHLDVMVADAATRQTTLWLGASDLAFALARAVFGEEMVSAPDLARPLAIMIGSRDPMTVAQVDQLSHRGVHVHRAPNGAFGPVEILGDTCVVAMSAGAEPCTEEAAAASFAENAVRVLTTMEPSTLLCTGGETADAILRRLGVSVMRLMGEVAAGLPVCEITAPWGEAHLITKSGGFGRADLLSELALGHSFAENKGINQDAFI
ncbi:MAG: four-carbon acid sugar kinase family protein [Hyphomicrobiales bacterium]